MFRRTLSLLLVVSTLSWSRAAIDLAPEIEEYSHAGFHYRKATFKADNGTVTFLPPPGWALRGIKDRLQLNPPDQRFAEGLILATPLKTPQPLDEPTIRALEQQVLASAPPSSQSAQLLSREENPILIGPHQSCQVAMTYELLGEVFQRSVIVVHTPDTQLVFRFTAPKRDFDVLNEAFRRSIASWEWLEAKPGSSATIAGPNLAQPDGATSAAN